uniref:Uncharacterized protein n=1 Tax=Cacopsylla melanoneura TaxID=428564 RepID=A0A8D8ZHR4_9HEMI
MSVRVLDLKKKRVRERKIDLFKILLQRQKKHQTRKKKTEQHLKQCVFLGVRIRVLVSFSFPSNPSSIFSTKSKMKAWPEKESCWLRTGYLTWCQSRKNNRYMVRYTKHMVERYN